MNNDLTAALAQFFDEDDWPAVFDEDAGAYVVRFRGTEAEWTCYAYPDEEDRQVAIYSVAPVTAERSRRMAVAEYLTRVNYGLVLGNFEMDFEDGEIRYKTSISVDDAELTPAMTGRLVEANVEAMDQYLPGLMLVLRGKTTPAEAAARMDEE